MSRAWLAALLALGCADADDAGAIDAAIVTHSGAVEVWLSADHPAAAAQARWGLPIRCPGFELVVLPIEALQTMCPPGDDPELQTAGCVPPGRCEIAIADGLDAAARELVITHELGHLLSGDRGHPSDGCPVDAPGEHLMCALGPASGSAEPTLADFDRVLP